MAYNDSREAPRFSRRATLRAGSLVLVAGVAPFLEACVPAVPGAAGGTADIPVGATLPLTGSASVLGDPMAKALQLTADDVNAAGGPLGRKIKLYVADDQTDPAAAARETQKLISLNNVVAVLGGNGSSVVLAQLPITTQAGVLDINQGGAPEITDPKFRPLTFRTQSTDYYYAMAHYAQEQGLKNVSAMLLNTTYSQVVMDQFEAEWKKLGMSDAPARLIYNPSQPSYSGELQQALRTQPELLLVLGYAGDTTIIAKEWYSSGSKSHFMGPDFSMNSDFIKNIGLQAAQGMIKIGPVPPVNAPGYLAFAGRFKDQTGLNLADYPNAAECHDQMNLVALAIEAAKSTKGADIAAKLIDVAAPPGEEVYDFDTGAKLLRQGKKINYQGADGPCDFDAQHNVSADFAVWLIDGQGTPQLAKQYAASEIASKA